MKNVILLLILIGIGLIGYSFITDRSVSTPAATENDPAEEMDALTDTPDTDRSVVPAGTYEVVTEESTVGWAGKKPLISGYINQGSIGLSEGSIEVGTDTATGEFVIDMNTLSVSDTPTKPGMESTLSGHLRSKNWFDVETYPTATFAITSVLKRPNSDATFVYDVTGDLTMKGQTHELTFPATIYTDAEGLLHTEADLEFDRTKWGITSGSSSFFDNLADNVIDDMVALSFTVVAKPAQ